MRYPPVGPAVCLTGYHGNAVEIVQNVIKRWIFVLLLYYFIVL